MPVEIGIVGAGNRGHSHADSYAAVSNASVVAVADIDQDAANHLADEYDIPGVYGEFQDMIDDADLDAVSVCVHNNLHRPVAEYAADAGELGETYYARGSHTRRRGRPYVDGYGTPAFVSKESAGGGPVIDIGTYVVGQLLFLLGNARVERVGGRTFEKTGDAYAEELVGDNRSTYTDRLEDSGYDVEDAGVGMAHLADGSVLELRSAWHMYVPDQPSVLAGSQGGVQLNPFEFYTTTSDYEATVSLDLDEFERRQGLLESEDGYSDDRGTDQFTHWIETVDGTADDPVPTGDIALNSMRVMEGIYLADQEGREVTADDIADLSESTAIDL